MGVLVGHSSPLGVAVEMRGLGLVAVLLCVALVLGQSQTGKKPSKGKLLSPPVPRKCSARPKRFKYQGHNYFYSGDVAPYKKIKYDWLDGRNFCREYCMDLVSLETQQENDYIQNWLKSRNLTYTWTSGRLCDFDGCDRPDLQPLNVKGGFGLDPTRRLPQPTRSMKVGITSHGAILAILKRINQTMQSLVSTTQLNHAWHS